MGTINPVTALGKRPYPSTGRTRQKARTREALLHALQALLDAGQDPSVAQVADAAGVSRTTAYRYFPDQQALLAAAMPETGLSSLLPDDAPDDPVVRLNVTLDAHFDFLRRWEPQLRAALRSSLLPGASRPTLRGGRAVLWYEQALPGPENARHELAVRLRAAAGIEPYIWLTDVAGLSPDEACRLMRENALAVLASASVNDATQR